MGTLSRELSLPCSAGADEPFFKRELIKKNFLIPKMEITYGKFERRFHASTIRSILKA